jgi:hypothetical protein
LEKLRDEAERILKFSSPVDCQIMEIPATQVLRIVAELDRLATVEAERARLQEALRIAGLWPLPLLVDVIHQNEARRIKSALARAERIETAARRAENKFHGYHFPACDTAQTPWKEVQQAFSELDAALKGAEAKEEK